MRRDAVTFDKMRRCWNCKRVKLLSEFSPKKNTTDRHYVCKPCHNQRAKEWYASNRERAIATRIEFARKLRDRAVVAAGGYMCACCGELRKSMLDIDHINNDGYRHRQKVGSSAWYHDVVENPSKYQVLCCNCNQSKRRNRGQCEHKTERRHTVVDWAIAETIGIA